MPKVSYMGNGSTTEFNFDFPFYENSDIVVSKNATTMTIGYTIVGTSAGSDANIPYTGGKVVFDVAPIATDSIVISRHLSLTRVVDYQPTAKLNPTVINQDMNYMIEVLKDFNDQFADFDDRYAELLDIESIQTISAKIDTVTQQIEALGDISTLRQDVSDLITTTGNHTTSISALDSRTANISDYVVASQAPTAENNYTWFRKYKSGWVEQGGRATLTVNLSAYQAHGPVSITLPVAINLVNGIANVGGDSGVFAADVYSISSTDFACYIQNCLNRTASYNATIRFVVYGFAV